MENVIGGWGKVHSNELHDLYLSLNIIHVKKSRKLGWAGYVKRIGEKKCIMDCGREPLRKETI